LASPAQKTPTKAIQSPFKLTAVSSATPTLDRAIHESAKKFKTPDLFNTSIGGQSPRNLSVFGSNDISLEMSPIVANKSILKNVGESPGSTLGTSNTQPSTPLRGDTTMELKTPEMILTPSAETCSVHSQPKTPSQPNSSPSPFPKLTPKVLSPTISNSRLSSHPDENLLNVKYRDSIAQFFKNTPKASSSLRQSVISMDQDSDVSSILPDSTSIIATAAETSEPTPRQAESLPTQSEVLDADPSPMKKPRDSVAAFFNQVHATTMNPRRPRDSVAPFFQMNDELSESESMALEESQEIQVDEALNESIDIDVELNLDELKKQVEANQSAAKKSKYRDSIAPFFAMNEATLQDESVNFDLSQDLTETGKNSVFEVKPVAETSLPSMDDELNQLSDHQELSMEESVEFSVAPEMTSTPAKESVALELDAISPVKSEKSISRSPRRESRRISSRSSTASSSPVTRSAKKKSKNDSNPVPMRVAVTPMRRAVAQKALQSASKSVPAKRPVREESPEVKRTPRTEPKRTPASAAAEPESPTQSPARRSARKRKSVGGNLLQTLQEIHNEFADDSFQKELDEIEIPESPFAKKAKPETEDLQEDSLINEEPMEEMLIQEPMDSFLADDFGGSSTSLDKILPSTTENENDAVASQENGDAENLMDQSHLSIMDTSMVQDAPILESPIQEIKTLEEFLAITGLQFATVEEVAVFSSHEFVADESLAGRIETQLMQYEEECYIHGSEELEKTIDQLQSTIRGFKQDMDENPPLLFDEFSQGTALERDETLANLQRSQKYCLLEARADWYPWKQLLFDRMFQNVQSHYENVEKDYETVAPLLEQFRQVGISAKSYLDEVTSNIEFIKQEFEAKVQELSQAKELLNNEKDERRFAFLT
jgi:hypothetical protein